MTSLATPGLRPSAHLDVFLESEAAGDLLHRGARRLVGPGGAGVADALDHDIVELDAVRAGTIRLRLLGLLEPVHAYRGAREVLVAATLDDVVALGDHLAVNDCLHAPNPLPDRGARQSDEINCAAWGCQAHRYTSNNG